MHSAQGIRFLKFGIVGGSGVLVNMGMLWLLVEVGGLFYIRASALAILASIINNFIWNDVWTWRESVCHSAHQRLRRFVKFCAVSGFSAYALNLGILWLLTQFADVYYLLANLTGIAVGTFVNFSLNHVWTFKA